MSAISCMRSHDTDRPSLIPPTQTTNIKILTINFIPRWWYHQLSLLPISETFVSTISTVSVRPDQTSTPIP